VRSPGLAIAFAAALTGCGGEGGLNFGTVDVTIVGTPSCQITGGTGILVDVEYQVTLELGQAFVSNISSPLSVPRINDFLSCGALTPLGNAGMPEGCQRGSDDAASTTLTHQHSEDTDVMLPPPPLTVLIQGEVHEAPFSPTLIANDIRQVDCF